MSETPQLPTLASLWGASPTIREFTHDPECELEIGAFACECPRVRPPDPQPVRLKGIQ